MQQLEAFTFRLIAHQLPRWQSLWNCVLALPTRKPLQAAYCWQPELAQSALRLTNKHAEEPRFDVIHIEHLRGAAYGLYLKERTSAPIVWDSVDSISHLFRQAAQQSARVVKRWVTGFELKRTEGYEDWLSRQFNGVAVTSKVDREAFLSLRNGAQHSTPITVIPNGVDLEYFDALPASARQPNQLVLTGKMSYHANVTMAVYLVRQIMPLVWALNPDVKLWIVGKDPAREVLALAVDERITITGMVSDIRPYLQRATLAVAPVPYGAGIQNKVLEAMACGTPVICTSQAVSALDLKPGIEASVVDEPDAFAREILRYLDDPLLRQQVGAAGRLYVEKHHTWQNVANRFENLYRQAAQTHMRELRHVRRFVV